MLTHSLPRLRDTGAVSIGRYRFERLALGAMRLLSTTAQVDGRTLECFADPPDPEANCRLMHAAVEECGIGYIDFARGYGARPGAGEQWFKKWMHPYPPELLWATKVGYERDNRGGWVLNLSPDFLRRELEISLEQLGRPIPLCYLTASSTDDVTVRHRPESVLRSLQPLLEFYEKGELQHLGVANVTPGDLRKLLDHAPIAVVQNKFTVASLKNPAQREVLEICREAGIPFVAWGIFQSDDESAWVPGDDLVQAAKEMGVSCQDASLSILLRAVPHLVALTGASRPTTLASSVRAANAQVPGEILERFTSLPV